MRRKKKPKSARKVLSIQIRVRADQKELLSEAAASIDASLGLSTWMLDTCLAAAKELKERKAKS